MEIVVVFKFASTDNFYFKSQSVSIRFNNLFADFNTLEIIAGCRFCFDLVEAMVKQKTLLEGKLNQNNKSSSKDNW